jgi:hypothetical protein
MLNMFKLCIVSCSIIVWSMHPTKNTCRKGRNYIYYKMNEITSLKKHENLDHTYAIVANKFEKKVNNFMRGTKQKQLTKKRPNVSIRDLFKKLL